MRWLLVSSAVLLAACVEPALPDADGGAPDAGAYVCSPMSCTGCCVLNTCLGGNMDMACGYAGRPCRQCEAGTACASPGTCVGLPSDGGAFPNTGLNDAGIVVDGFERPNGKPQRCIWLGWQIVCY